MIENMDISSLRICLISGTYPNMLCGVGLHTYYLAEAFASQGLQLYVITTQSHLIPEDLCNKEYPRLNFVEGWNLRTYFFIQSLLQKINPDIVHIQLPVRISGIYTTLLLPFLRLTLLRKFVILTLHEFSEGLWLSKVRGLFLIACSPYIIFPNPNDLKLALRFFPFMQHKFFHIPIGPTLPIREVLEKEKPVRDRTAIAYLGILYPRKGLETLLMAIAKVAPRIPEIRLHILSSFSGKNPYHRSIKMLAEQLDISDNIVWYSDLTSYTIVEHLIRCNITCLPYPGGATFRRSTLLEALTAQTAVITTKSDLTPQQLVHGENVYLVPPDDPLALSKAIEHLYLDNTLTYSIRREGFKLAQKFTWTKIARKTLEVYRKVIKGKQRGLSF